jgi:glycosyltransferase involved in cell wall biosynthesis
MEPLTIGVAIITYNGLKFLPEQLGSILSQSRKVDHIVVSDDRSTDGT